MVSLLCSIGGEDSDQKFIDVRMRAVGRKIVILSGKGGQPNSQLLHEPCCSTLTVNSSRIECEFFLITGVGKSTIASCLSMTLAELSAQVSSYSRYVCQYNALKQQLQHTIHFQLSVHVYILKCTSTSSSGWCSRSGHMWTKYLQANGSGERRGREYSVWLDSTEVELCMT